VGNQKSLLTDQGKKYLLIGAAVAAGILLIVAVILVLTGNQNEAMAVGAATLAAAGTAATANQSRTTATTIVNDTKTGIKEATSEIKENHDDAEARMGAVNGEVASSTDAEKITEGNDLLGPK
jgi:hypothetical protein